MAEAKTQPTSESAVDFIDRIEDPQRRADCHAVLKMFRKASGAPAVMWGPAIIGFGRYRVVYANGSTAEWLAMGFSPRKTDLTLYLSNEFDGYDALMAKLGKHKTSKACLYIKRLSDVDLPTLETLIQKSAQAMAPRRVDR